jgi:hypothetical protein
MKFPLLLSNKSIGLNENKTRAGRAARGSADRPTNRTVCVAVKLQ